MSCWKSFEFVYSMSVVARRVLETWFEGVTYSICGVDNKLSEQLMGFVEG